MSGLCGSWSVVCALAAASLVSGCAFDDGDERASSSSSDVGRSAAAATPGAVANVLPPYQWSAWLNRDNPSGNGDFEDFADFTAAQVGCALPAQINAVTVFGGVSWPNTGEVLQVSPDFGLVCRNANQPDGACQDYQVQFGCATSTNLVFSALPQSWHQNVPATVGAILDFVPLAVEVPPSRAFETITFRADGSFSIMLPGPTDAPETSTGTWARSGQVITVSYFTPRTGITTRLSYQIAELTSSVLRFRQTSL